MIFPKCFIKHQIIRIRWDIYEDLFVRFHKCLLIHYIEFNFLNTISSSDGENLVTVNNCLNYSRNVAYYRVTRPSCLLESICICVIQQNVRLEFKKHNFLNSERKLYFSREFKEQRITKPIKHKYFN